MVFWEWKYTHNNSQDKFGTLNHTYPEQNNKIQDGSYNSYTNPNGFACPLT